MVRLIFCTVEVFLSNEQRGGGWGGRGSEFSNALQNILVSVTNSNWPQRARGCVNVTCTSK
jgi:hypothetical protein